MTNILSAGYWEALTDRLLTGDPFMRRRHQVWEEVAVWGLLHGLSENFDLTEKVTVRPPRNGSTMI